MDLAKLNGSSGIARYRGLGIESKDGIKADGSIETFDVAIDGVSESADQRDKEGSLKITITPSGEWVNPDRLYPYLDWPLGRTVLPVLPVAIDATSNHGTITKHLLYDGDRVLIGTVDGGTLPGCATPIDPDTFYYVHVVDADTVTFHLTQANALANTAAIDFTSAGSGVKIVGQFPLEIYTVDGDYYMFHAVAISKQPDFTGSSEKTPFGQVEFTAYVRSRKRRSDPDAYFTPGSQPFPGWMGSSSDIKTQSPLVSWADQLAFDSGAIDTDEDTIALPAHGLSSGAAVFIGTTGTLPGAASALDPEKKYYVHAVDGDTVTLHTTQALGTSGDTPIDLTSGGTGRHWLTVENAPFTLMDTEAGVSVTFDCKLDPVPNDKDGPYNARLSSSMATAKFIASTLAGVSMLAALKLQGTGAGKGRSLNSGSKPLNIFSAGMFVRVYGAALKQGGIERSMKVTESRELNFTGTRVKSNGVLQPVGVVGTEIP